MKKHLKKIILLFMTFIIASFGFAYTNEHFEKDSIVVNASTKVSSTVNKSRTVYWTPSGKCYHCTKHCRTLSRSKKIYKGTVAQAKKNGKKRKCKVCY